MTVKKLYMMPCGRCWVDRSALDTRREPGELADLPIWAYLIETTDGPILVDTGMPESCVADSAGLFKGTEDEGRILPQMHEEDVVTRILARAGYRPEDLVCLVSTHWHFDHAGGNTLFPATQIVVQQAEYNAAMYQDNYFNICKNPMLRYRFIQGDAEIVPGVTLLFTPGHTPGHQSVLVRTEQSGSVLLTVDAAYCGPNYEENVPFATWDPAAAAKSIARLKEIAASEKAAVFYGHDETQGRSWNVFPLPY